MLLAVAPIVSTAQAVTIPIDDLAGILVVKATVNGKGPYHFVLDTGAGITVITPELAKAVHAERAGNETAHGTGDKEVAVRTTTLDTVSLGAAKQQNVPTAIIPLPPDLTYQGAYGTIDGIVGSTFLRNYAVSIDIGNLRASFTPTSEFRPPSNVGAVPVAFTKDGLALVTATVNGAEGRFEIDSGNNSNVVLTQAFVAQHNLAGGYRAPMHSLYVGVGGSTDATTIRVRTFSIGGFTVHGVGTDISQSKTSALQNDRLDGNIGYEVLRQFVVTLDYAGARLYLQPGSQFDTNKTVAGTGIIPQRNADGTFGVVSVLDASPASVAGVKPGETILAINGKRTPSMSDADYKSAVGETAGASVTYTLRSGSSEREVTMTTVDLLPPIAE